MNCPECGSDTIGDINDWCCVSCEASSWLQKIMSRGYGDITDKVINDPNYIRPNSLEESMQIAMNYYKNHNKDLALVRARACTLANELEIAEKLRTFPACTIEIYSDENSYLNVIPNSKYVKELKALSVANKIKLELILIKQSAASNLIATFDGFGLESINAESLKAWEDLKIWLQNYIKPEELVTQERINSFNFVRHSRV